MNVERKFSVRAVSCGHRATDDDVYRRLSAAVEPLSRSWERLGRAKTIAIKFNQDFPHSHMFESQRRELVSDSVAGAVLRLLRERTDAELLCADAGYLRISKGTDPAETTQIAPLLEEYGVGYLDCTEPPLQDCPVPGGGAMFASYRFPIALMEADELVSVAKMKNHGFMGVTGCLKNLFGLMPAEPHARPRRYYHHLVRMPYMLADIGRILDPALNVVDALVGQAGMEWVSDPGPASGRIVDALIAGDHPVATDACMTHLMGHDPGADWLTDPFLRDRNSLLVSRESGFGTNLPDDIDFLSEVRPLPAGTFYCKSVDPTETVIQWRKTMCEQALNYRDNRKRYGRYDGQYVLLQRGEVRWHSRDGRIDESRRVLAGDTPNESLYFKFVDPEEREGERYEVYERALRDIEERKL